MANLRWGKRFCADLKTRFGIEDYSEKGLINDLSVFGFFLRSSKSFPFGTLLKIRILTPEGLPITLEGTVQWNQKRSMGLIWVTKEAGMGIQIKQFLAGQNHYDDLCQQLCGNEAVEKTGDRGTGLSTNEKGEFLKKIFRR
jgi:hypothetical protein